MSERWVSLNPGESTRRIIWPFLSLASTTWISCVPFVVHQVSLESRWEMEVRDFQRKERKEGLEGRKEGKKYKMLSHGQS